MSKSGSVETDILFKGLTRPAMIMGVSFPYAILNASLSLLIFVMAQKLAAIVVLLPSLHLLGYWICFKEPLFVELYLVKIQNFNKCSNKIHYGGNSYDHT